MRRLIIVAGVAFAVVWILIGVHYYRYRFVRENNGLVRLLPPGDLTVVYADLDLIRKAQLLGILANIKVAPDKEYSDFLGETGFDYTRDLDAIVVGKETARTFLIGRGHFDWDKMTRFAVAHKGQCADDACRVPASSPGRWVNLISIQPDVVAVAVSGNPAGADDLRPPGRRLQEDIPDAPVWAKLSHSLLSNPAALPLPFQIVAISLQSADSVTIAAQLESLKLNATFANAAAAETARRQLEMQTRFVTTALKDEKPDRASLAGLLTGGSFQVIGTDMKGSWPIDPALLKALQ